MGEGEGDSSSLASNLGRPGPHCWVGWAWLALTLPSLHPEYKIMSVSTTASYPEFHKAMQDRRVFAMPEITWKVRESRIHSPQQLNGSIHAVVVALAIKMAIKNKFVFVFLNPAWYNGTHSYLWQQLSEASHCRLHRESQSTQPDHVSVKKRHTFTWSTYDGPDLRTKNQRRNLQAK